VLQFGTLGLTHGYVLQSIGTPWKTSQYELRRQWLLSSKNLTEKPFRPCSLMKHDAHISLYECREVKPYLLQWERIDEGYLKYCGDIAHRHE
jgi:hypothetical protein